MGSASCEAVDRQARLEGQWRVLAKGRNTADERFTTRPKGATRMIQYGVAALVKDMPFTADCALSWIIRVALNPSDLPGWTTSIPQPTAYDLERAIPDQNWHWQPNAIDFSAAGDAAVILTYSAVYYFSRRDQQSWLSALQSTPLRFDLGAFREAESVVFDNTGENIYVTTEKRGAPLLRLRLNHE